MNKEIGATVGGRDWGAIIPGFLNDYGLDPYEMRVYIRLARRAGMGGQCWESIGKMARACSMSERKLKDCLALLVAANLVKQIKRSGATDLYELLPEKHWVHPQQLDSKRSQVTAYRAASDQKRRHAYQQEIQAQPRYEAPRYDAPRYETPRCCVPTTQVHGTSVVGTQHLPTQVRGTYKVFPIKKSLEDIPQDIPHSPLTPQGNECEGNNLPAEKMGGGSPAHLPVEPIDQFELLEKKNCHENQFSPAIEKVSGSQPDFSASLLDQSSRCEKPNNFRQGKNSAAETPPSCFEMAAIQPHASFFKQPVEAELGQPSFGEGIELRELLEQTPSMNPGALDQTSGYVLALSPSAASAPKALFSQEHSATTRSQNEDRASRHQRHLPKNLDGSDRLPWDTEKRGMFDPQFENWMARSLMQYPAYRDLMAGELMTKVRKHISAGRYDLKRRDELLIEWSAMQTQAEMGVVSSNLTAKGAARRAKIARALSMEVS